MSENIHLLEHQIRLDTIAFPQIDKEKTNLVIQCNDKFVAQKLKEKILYNESIIKELRDLVLNKQYLHTTDLRIKLERMLAENNNTRKKICDDCYERYGTESMCYCDEDDIN